MGLLGAEGIRRAAAPGVRSRWSGAVLAALLEDGERPG